MDTHQCKGSSKCKGPEVGGNKESVGWGRAECGVSGRKSVHSGEGGWGADLAGVLSHSRESGFYSEWI